MSFTLFHTRKDGTVKPIKVSIFDAFRGVPDPKPRKPPPCPCCGTAHRPKPKPAITPSTKAEDKDASKDDKAKEADDQTMLRMKAEDSTTQWKDILEATSYTDVEELKARWRQIKDKLPDFKKEMEAEAKKKENGRKDRTKSNKKKSNDPDREARAAKAREEGLKKQQEARERREAAAKAEKNKTDQSKALTRRAPGDMVMWSKSFDRKKWRLLASKHFDETGRRITPDEARKMMQGK